MKLTYRNNSYECVKAVKSNSGIAIHTGRVEDGEEIIYHIYGDINFDEVVLEGGTWTQETTETPSQLDVIEAQVTYTAMMTDTLLEV